MKKTIILSLLLMLAIGTYSQQWVYSCSSNNSLFYVYSKCRNVAPNQYIVFIRQSHIDLYQERKRLAEILKDNNKYNNYSYTKDTYLIDINHYKTKTIETTRYDTNDNVIDTFRFNDDEEWHYAQPETISEGIIDTVKEIVSKE